MKTFTFWSIILGVALGWSSTAFAQPGCPGCTVDLSDTLAEDTIFIGDLPDGEVGTYYEADLSFRVPKSTTPVAAADSTVLPGLNIDKITITDVNPLPEGINWEASQLEFEVSEETDGCVRFCGLPTESGHYEILVELEAEIFIITQRSSFIIPLYIAPASSMAETFSMENNVGCGQTKVSFTNLIPSNGVEGYSYFWDFGNGETSMAENPEDVTFSGAGEYEVEHTVVVDTSGYFLKKVTVLEGNCTDLIGQPDYYISVINPDGEEIYLAQHYENEQLPLDFDLDIELGEGTYMLQVNDEDGGLDGNDDRCAEFSFTRTDTFLTTEGVQVELDIEHRVDTLQSSDTVFVFAFPTPPAIMVDGSSTICAGDSVILQTTNYTTNLQWSRNGETLDGEESATLTVTEAGAYRVGYKTPAGCTAISPAVPVTVNELPADPVFVHANNLLSIADPSILPASYELQWFKGDIEITGATELNYCTKEGGLYTLVVTDLMTGCSNSYSFETTYDPDIIDCTVGVEELQVTDFKLFPNPTKGWVQIEFTLQENKPVTLEIVDMLGRVRSTNFIRSTNRRFVERVDLSSVASGVYFLRLQAEEKVFTERIVKQ